MKRLNVKKLAAIGIGAALLGTALAPMVTAKFTDLAKSDIIGSDGKPVVDIVGGSNGAAVSDYIWAGNIAVRVAQLATMDKSVVLTPGTEGGESTPTGLSVDLTVGGTESYSSDSSHTYDDNTMSSNILNKEFLLEIDDGKLAFLKDEILTYRINSTSYDQRIEEKIGLDLDAAFETQAAKSMGELIVSASSINDFNYEVLIQEGIPITFESGDANKIDIFLFGEKFKVQSVSGTSPDYTITLMKDSETQVIYEGGSLTDLEGDADYAGQTMTVTFDSLTETGSTATYKADFSLYDEEGNLVDTYSASAAAYLNDQFVDSSGNYPLKGVVYIESVAKESTTNKGKVSVTTGSAIAKMKHNHEYPYRSTRTSTTEDYWVTEITAGTQTITSETAITKITIKSNNNGLSKRSTQSPLYAEKSAFDADKAANNEWVFLAGEEDAAGYGIVTLKFEGWKADQSVVKVEIGSVTNGPSFSSYDGSIGYTDNGGTPYYGANAVPFVITGSTGSLGSSFSFMGDTIYYKCDEAAVFDLNVADPTPTDTNAINGLVQFKTVDCDNATVADANIIMLDGRILTCNYASVDLNGVTYTITTLGSDNNSLTLTADGNCQFATQALGGSTAPSDSEYIDTANHMNTFYYDDKNTTSLAFYANPVSLTTTGIDDTVEYAFYASEADGEFYLLLEDSTNLSGYYTSDVAFIGTDNDEDLETELSYYVPNYLRFGGGSTGVYYVAHFNVSENLDITALSSSGDYNVFINTETGKPLGADIGSTNLSSYSGDVNVFRATGGSTTGYDMRTNHSSYVANSWSDYGTKTVLTEDAVTFTIPENQEKLKFIVYGEGTTTVVSGGEALTGLGDGDTGKTSGGTEVTVSAINYTAGTCGVGDAVATPSKYSAVVSAGDLVYDDSYVRAGNHIIIGGHKVNNLAVGLGLSDGTTLEEALTSPGQYVAEMLADGDIIVAGYTASDTKTAAQELIAALEALK
ncbi:MAG: hypothetical protein V1672_03745 [Candidatus Diapherotrites archaeon]